MNVYQQSQVPGIQWANPLPGSLYQPDQSEPSGPRRLERQPDFLRSLELQMQLYAREHEAILEKVRESYILDPEPLVRDLLNEHRAVPHILLEAAHYLKASFGDNAVLVLRTSIPETGPRTLYAVVMWTGSISHVRQALDDFDNQWWLSRAALANGHLFFTYELV